MTPEKLDELEQLFDDDGITHIWTDELRDLIAAARREAALREALAKARSIIEMADVRAEAADGPVLHVRDTMTDGEWRELYRLLSEVPQ